jgi:hypothetical protein
MNLRNLKTNGLAILALGLTMVATASAAIDPVLLNLVMPDAKILSGIQVDQSVASPFGQYVLGQMQAGDDGFQKFILSTGFDPRRDLHEVLAATNSDGSSKTVSVLAIGRGVFVPSQILATATAEGGTITSYRGFSIIAEPGSASPTAIVFFDASTVAAGDLASVKAAIDRKVAGNTFSGPLAQKAKDASATNQAWFATVSPLSVFLGDKLGSTGLSAIGDNTLLQSVVQASGGVNFGSATVTVTGDAMTTSGQNAQALVDILKFLVSLVPSSDPNIKSLASGATFSVNGTTAHLVLALPEQQLEQLFMPHVGAKAHKARAAQVR